MTRPIHPLTGANPATLAHLFAANGPPAPRHWPAAAGMIGSGLGRTPVSLAERAYTAAMRGRASGEPPVFILGHWRSGTTHLFNLLSGSPAFTYATPIPAGLPWDFLLLGRALRPLLRRAIPQERHIDPMEVTETAPQEDEIGLAAMTQPSYYHGVYFPSRLRDHMRAGLFFDGCGEAERARWRRAVHCYTDKVSIAAGGRRVLVKNPAHTAHVGELLKIWPDARIVHIVRNPYHVYSSTRRMFTDLLDMLALQDTPPGTVDNVTNETYPRMMDALLADTTGLPAHQFVQVDFESLEARPLDTVAHVADRLALPDREAMLTAAQRHLDHVARYSKRTREVSVETIAAVNTHWDRHRAHWGYARMAETEA
ncbi:Sulfotransferase family protein [Limimonas halophila]|uniref:Sulfotransferase family protein n=1 Tax=Limimonas halophila TaxID=1082479 RepID=A0A1G7P4R4_9PROT|nr:sulfotransferase [Limimonas halophila]SDF81087.1 Sulfotransferase family protein [Limimonas halophila]